jgi:APA family basic amino acid/polyamine antiporter
MKDAPRPFKVNLILPAIFVLFCIVLVVVTLLETPRDAGIGLVLIAAGIPFYYFWNKRAQAEGITNEEA